MTLDESPSHRAEMDAAICRQHDDDNAQRLADLLDRDECESEDALAAYWAGVMAASPWKNATFDESRPGIDRRMFSVNGERPA